MRVSAVENLDATYLYLSIIMSLSSQSAPENRLMAIFYRKSYNVAVSSYNHSSESQIQGLSVLQSNNWYFFHASMDISNVNFTVFHQKANTLYYGNLPSAVPLSLLSNATLFIGGLNTWESRGFGHYKNIKIANTHYLSWVGFPLDTNSKFIDIPLTY